MAFRRCPDCGAYLDPGERCDCGEGMKWIVPAAAQVQRAKKEGALRLVSRPRPASKTVASV